MFTASLYKPLPEGFMQAQTSENQKKKKKKQRLTQRNISLQRWQEQGLCGEHQAGQSSARSENAAAAAMEKLVNDQNSLMGETVSRQAGKQELYLNSVCVCVCVLRFSPKALLGINPNENDCC